MIFDEIKIEGFRGINKLDIKDLSSINLFVGKNNSSKTSILEAIFLLSGINPGLTISINNFRDLIMTEENDFRFIFHNLNYDNILTITGSAKENGYKRTLNILPSTTNKISTPEIFNDINIRRQLESIAMTSKINELTLEYYIGEKRHTGKVTFMNNDFNISPFIPFQNYDSNFKAVYVPPAFHSFSPNLEKRLEQLINSKQEHEIIEILNKVDNNIQGISFGLNRMINIDIGLDRLIPLNLLGEGIRRLLTIVLSIYDAKDGIVMIDELENGLHFSTLKCLWRAVVYSSKKYNAQIFATSHNYETLKYLMEVLDEPENIKYQEEVRNFTIRKISELEHKSYCYKFPEFHHAIEEGIELR